METADVVARDAAVIVVGFSMIYVLILTFLGVRAIRGELGTVRCSAITPTAQHGRRRAKPRDDYAVYFLIPCLNEQDVIQRTVQGALVNAPSARVVVIDDASDDRTAAIAEACGDRVTVVRRTLPKARLGKGEALNAGLQVARVDVAERGLDPEHVIICVMDADGILSSGATDDVLAKFEDPRVGGVQLMVRIGDRRSVVLRFQDMEFWAVSGVSQIGRMVTGTVSLGGNGQFTRLSALDEVGLHPWSQCLTEDLDLSISLAIRGWKTSSSTTAYVEQQGVDNLRRLLNQRTRWFQGHMQCARRIPDLVRSRTLGNVRFFEITGYLAVPWLSVLPWSILQQYIAFRVVTGHGAPGAVLSSGPLVGRVGYLVLWYAVSLLPQFISGWLYWRRGEDVSIRRAIFMSHLSVLWAYLSYLAAWRALGRLVLRRGGWTKTTHYHLDEVPQLVAST